MGRDVKKPSRWSAWKHAFAVDPPGPVEPTPEQREVVDWFCREVARRGLTTPGLMFLEMSRPLNFLTSQFMHWVQPAVWAVAPAHITANYDHFAKFLEHRGSVDYILRRIEEFEAEFVEQSRGPGKARRKRLADGPPNGATATGASHDAPSPALPPPPGGEASPTGWLSPEAPHEDSTGLDRRTDPPADTRPG